MTDTSKLEDRFFQGEKPDPELLSLPAPAKKKRRHPALAALVLLMGGVILYWMHNDILYFFVAETPQELGDIAEADPGALRSNTYVHFDAFPNPTKVVKFSKRGRKGFFRIFPVIGAKNIFIQLRVAEVKDAEGKKKPPSSEVPGDFMGRLVRFKDLESGNPLTDSYKDIRRFFFEKFLVEIPKDAILVMHEDNPRGYWMYPLLGAVVLVFMAVNLFLLVSPLVRKPKKDKAGPKKGAVKK